MLTRRYLLAGAGAAAACVASSRADAQTTYASQPVHILVGYPAGGGVDIVARLLQDPLKAALGQPVIVENRTGASAMLATGAVAKAAPDGYTLLACASGEVAINHFLFKEKMAYDPAKELAPIALVGIVPCVVVVASETPVSNPKELITYIKQNPEKLSFSSSGIGNPQQLAGELMNTMAGTKVLHVPYRGAAPAVTDVATGAVTMSFTSLAAALPLIQAGKIKVVAVTSRERMPQLPDIAPLSEGAPGLAGYELLNWFAIFGTAGTPPGILERLNGIINAALQDPAISGKLLPQGIVPKPMKVAEFKAFVDAERTKFGKIVEQANIKLSN
jgi:tripartite-type tricarboxylate transporter receptor subunit TctC